MQGEDKRGKTGTYKEGKRTCLQGGGPDLRKGEKRRGWLQEAGGGKIKSQGKIRVLDAR